jgi:hypothetical protein
MWHTAGVRRSNPGDKARPSAVAHDRQLQGELKIDLTSLEQPVIEKIPQFLRLQSYTRPHAPIRGQQLQAA